MAKRFDRKIEEIMQTLHAGGFVMKGIRNGIRVKMENGMDVDIYTLKSDPEHIRARIKTDVADEAARTDILTQIREQLRQGLGELAEMEEFRLTKQENGVFSYYTRIFFGPDELLIFEDLNPSQLKISPQEEANLRKAGGGLADEIADAMALLEPIDPKMFRQALDDLGLSRSSLLRVILTRLFRAAVDSEALEIAIEEEAERITDPQDRMALEQLRAFNTIDFLDPLIRMLHRQSASGT